MNKFGNRLDFCKILIFFLTIECFGLQASIENSPLQKGLVDNLQSDIRLAIDQHQVLTLDATKKEAADSLVYRHGFSDNEEADCSVQFQSDYLEKYYPKAYVIRESFFACMTPDQLDAALAAVVAILTEKPWYYFADKQDAIKIGTYWEHIVDQCSLISEFLKKARVDLTTNNVFLPETLKSDLSGNYFGSSYLQPGKKKLEKGLLLYFKEKNKTAVWDFYALCFDYLIKLFNEGFLLRDLKQVCRYFDELEFVMSKLRGTKYEKSYQEVMKNCKELITLLKNKIKDSKQVMHEDDFHV